MNKSHYIGQKTSNFEAYGSVGAITGVILIVDDEHEFMSGDDTGYVMEIECPYGTQDIADDLLESLQGKKYSGYRADGAELDMGAELGDGVTVNGLYSLLAYQSVNFGGGHLSDISAPGDEELDHEYPYLTSEERALRRTVKLGQSYYGTTISRQYGVRVETVDAEGNVIATATFNSGGISFTTPDGSGVSLGADGKFHGNLVMDGSITWDDLSEAAQERIDADKGDDNPSYIRSTYINEAKIISPDIYGGMFYATGKGADETAAYYIYDGAEIKSGGRVTLGNKVGYLSYDTNGTGTNENKNRVLLTTLGGTALKINASGNMSLEADEIIYLHTPLGLTSGTCFGSSLPSSGIHGQLFFLEAGD